MGLLRRRKWIGFSADNGVSVVMYRRFARRLARDPRLRLFHFMHFKRVRRTDASLREDTLRFFADLGIHDGVVHYKLGRNLPLDLYVTPNFNDKLHNDRAERAAQVFHGVSFKNYCVKEKALRYHRLFLPGEYHRRRFVESGLLREDDPRLRLVGLPMLDPLVDGSLDRDEILRGLGLDPARKTVLYAPTGDAGNSLHRHGEQILPALEGLGVNVVCKPHDHAAPDPKCATDWLARLGKLESDRLKVERGFDIVPLLFAADLLLTDASSCAFEYALLDRPIVFYDVPEIFEGPYAAQFDMETWGRRAGHVVRDVPEMTRTIGDLLDDPSEKSELRRALATDLFHEPGRATDHAVAAVLDEVGLDPLTVPAGAAAAART